jgi:hypothetical protein
MSDALNFNARSYTSIEGIQPFANQNQSNTSQFHSFVADNQISAPNPAGLAVGINGVSDANSYKMVIIG